MLFIVALVVLLVTASVCVHAAKDEPVTGTILSAQFYCDFPCEDKMGFYLSSTTPADEKGVTNPFRIQQYLPPVNINQRRFDVFTAFDKQKSVYTTVAVNYPQSQYVTVWTSSVSGTDAQSMAAKPILEAVQIKMPLSSGPAPLNFAPMKLTKIVSGPAGSVLAVFANGEVHELDAEKGTFTLLHKLISDEQALSIRNPSTLHGHVFDEERNGLWSVVNADMSAYLVFTDFKTNKVGELVQMDAGMKLSPGVDSVTTDFSPEWFVNALMVDIGDGHGSQLMVQLQSVSDSVGFDQLSFVNTTSGLMTGPEKNMMNDNIVMQCQSFNCDLLRLSAYDPATKTVYWQGHSRVAGSEGDIVFAGLHFTTSKNDKPTWYVNIPRPNADFGYAGFQWYAFK